MPTPFQRPTDYTSIIDTFIAEASCYETVETGRKKGVLRTIRGPVAEWGTLNRNRRDYTERLWDNVLESPYVKEQTYYKTLFGEGNHPSDRFEVDFFRVAHRIVEMWKVPEKSQVYATIEILDTPMGQILNTLYESGSIIGYSSRAGGQLIKQKDRVVVDEKSYNFITFDAVPYPSVVAARPDEFLTEGAVIPCLVTLTEETHQKLESLIRESSSNEREIMKDFIYSLQGYDFTEEKELFESLSGGTLPKDSSVSPVEETTKFLLKENAVQVSNLQNKVSSALQQLSAEKGRSKKLETALNESKSLIENLQADLAKAKSQITESSKKDQDTIRGLEARIQEQVDRADEMELELERLQGIETAFRAIKESAPVSTEPDPSLVSENFELKKKISQLQESLKTAERDLNESCGELGKVMESTERDQTRISELETQVQALTAANRETQKLYESTKTLLDSASSTSSEELDQEISIRKKLESRVQVLSEQVESSEQSLEAAREESRKLKAVLESVQKDLATEVASKYGLTWGDISEQVDEKMGSKELYLLCESAHNSARPSIGVLSVEGSKIPTEEPPAKPEARSKAKSIFTNRRGNI